MLYSRWSWRALWIQNTAKATAVVLYVEEVRLRRSSGHHRPVVTFSTGQNQVTAAGTLNLPVKSGDTLNILYNKSNPSDWRIDDLYWLWFDILDWYQFIPLTIGLYYLVRYIVYRLDPRFARRKLLAGKH
ncbi:MAG: hypothetical protein EOP04_11160 [Proteobacteria bacterium]|nr:MAG: hypothetical protein EOP04_11160 [Pseudomonadota bacterium]